MPKLIVLLTFFLLLTVAGMTQSSRISGKISDTAEKKDLPGSSILLLRKTDSTLVRFTRAGKTGEFLLNKVPAGQYLLLVTYPTYADYVDEMNIKDSADITLPPIGMVLKSVLLQAAVVSGSRAIRIKGDTVEFHADSFHTQQGATVEDLLKKLPGIQVDHNGQITAQGETVKKVLVDGEEFFGDDPTLVTQNLRADMVDKVQVFDKKSDQATFTGIDDGQREKTINLKLKDSKKNGYFGRLTAGGATNGYYDLEMMVNYFRKKMKLAAYGIVSNTGKTGLNWQERDNYGQSVLGNADVDENTGLISITSTGDNNDLDSWSGQYEGKGFPAVKTGGLHYNNKWDNDLQNVNGNYKYLDLAVNGNSATNSQYILPDTFYYNNQSQKFNNRIIRHSINGAYEMKFDSTSSLKLLADGGTDHKTTTEIDSSEALASDSSLVNRNGRAVSTLGDTRIVNSDLLWRKRLAKQGRTISVNLRENYTNNNSSGFLYSNTQFFSEGLSPRDSLVDQYKVYHTENVLLDTRLTYTEPLSKISFLTVDYGLSVNNSHSDRNSFNRDAGGKYSMLDSLYSSNYQNNIVSQQGGLSYNLVKKKIRFNIGNDIGFSTYDQRDLHADTSITRHFVNWYPHASLGYNFTSQRRLSLNYSGNTTPPTIQQLQPVLTNEDPLNITIGNPGLKPQFANRVFLFFNDYKILTERGIFTNIGVNFTPNAISNRVDVDTTGKRTTQYINVNGNYNVNGYIGYSFKWKKPDLHFDFYTNIMRSNNVSVVNDQANTTRSGTYDVGFYIFKSKEKKYDLSLHYSTAYTTSQSSINTGVTTHYFTYLIEPTADIFLPLHFQIHGEGSINLRQKTSVFDNNNDVVLLNAWFGKKLLKNNTLLLKAAVNDLLNQNTGFQRTVNSNFISQNTYSTIKRYFMFSVVWNFAKAGTPVPNQQD